MTESEATYRLLFEQNPNPMWVFERETLRFLAVNDAAVRHYGYSREEFLAMTVREIRPAADVPVFEAYSQFYGENPEIDRHGTWRHIKKSGELIYVEVACGMLDFQGRPAGLVSIKDVTGRLRIEQEWREKEQELRRVLESISDYVWSAVIAADGQFKYRYYSPVVEKITGRPAEFFVQGDGGWLAIMHPDDRQKLVAKARSISEGRTDREVGEYRIILPDGGIRWVRDSVTGEWVGSERHLFGVVSDITAIKDAESALARYEEEQRVILNSLRAMIWYKDGQNKVLRCNRAALEFMGQDGAVPGDAATEENLEIIRSKNPRLGVEEELLQPTGEKRWVMTDKIPYQAQGGEVKGVIVCATDITEQKRREAELQEKEKKQREFVANVSHQFRTPLAAIKGFAETLISSGRDDEKRRMNFLKTIDKHATRLNSLIEELLALSTVEADALTLVRDRVDLGMFVETCVSGLAALIRRRRIVVKVQLEPGLFVHADERYLTQAFENLLSNAIRFNRYNGWIRITSKRNGDGVILSVADGGSGIAAEDLPRIFDRFYRGRTGKKGSGLGLHIAKKIIDLHGGTISVESELGIGSTFHVKLPG